MRKCCISVFSFQNEAFKRIFAEVLELLPQKNIEVEMLADIWDSQFLKVCQQTNQEIVLQVYAELIQIFCTLLLS